MRLNVYFAQERFDHLFYGYSREQIDEVFNNFVKAKGFIEQLNDLLGRILYRHISICSVQYSNYGTHATKGKHYLFDIFFNKDGSCRNCELDYNTLLVLDSFVESLLYQFVFFTKEDK